MTLRSCPTPATILLILAVACASDRDNGSRRDANQATALTGPRPEPQIVAAAVDSLAARVVAEGLSPAFGVALVMDGRTLLAKSYGMADVTNGEPADGRTLWYVASTSKSFTGVAVSLLALQGSVGFEAPITTLVPRARWPERFDAGRLTLANFLSHTHQLNDRAIVMTASFTGSFPEFEWPAMLRFATPTRGHDLAYSNLGYYVAAMVIDARRPEGWRRFLDSAVHEPAGLTETYTLISGLDRRRIAMPHDLRGDGRYVTGRFPKVDATMNAAGGHLATMHDLAKWVTVQIDNGMIDGRQVLPADAIALSHRLIAHQTREDRRQFAFFHREGWGAGWDVGSYEGEPMLSRFGSYASTRSHLSFLPARRVGIVTQANGGVGSIATDIIAAFAYDLERGDPRARARAEERFHQLRDDFQADLARKAREDSVRAARHVTLRRPLSDLAGSYSHPWYGTVVLEVRADSVSYVWGVLSGTADVVEARSCSWRGCRYSNGLVIDAGGPTAVEFDFPRSGHANSLRLNDETFIRR